MSARSHHSTAGSDPATMFDHWLDDAVTGTPGFDASRNQESTGQLARAQAGARQLHGLAARTMVTPALMPARHRVKEYLMHNGALAAPDSGIAWQPRRRQEQQVPWWSLNSPFVAVTLMIALIASLVGGAFWNQQSVLSPPEKDAPGFAVASPQGTPTRQSDVSDLLIIRGASEQDARALRQHVGVLQEDGLTIYRPNAEPLAFPGVVEVFPTGVPGQGFVTRNDASRAVVSLETGEELFAVPESSEHESLVLPYLFISETGENADWTVHDLRNGATRELSEIVELPDDLLAIPVRSGPDGTNFSGAVVLHFVSQQYEVSPTKDISSFVIAGSLDKAITLDGYPPKTKVVGHYPVVSDDGDSVAWITDQPGSAVVVADTSSGDELARLDLGDLSPEAELAGFIDDAERLVVTTADRISIIDWDDGQPHLEVVADGLNRIGGPLLHTPSETLYFRESGALKRIELATGAASTVVPTSAGDSVARFTEDGSQWIIVNAGGNASLINAGTGEIVSQLIDVPPNQAEFNAYSTTASFDGSTMLQVILDSDAGDPNSAWLLSPRFENGLVLTAPIDSEAIAGSVSPDGIPVHYTISPDGQSVAAGTVGRDGYAPQYIASIQAEPDWVPISDDVTNLYWIPMLPVDLNEPEVLPAQDFATPQDDAYVTSISVTAQRTITLSITVDGETVFDGELAAGESTPFFDGSRFEVETSSGANTLFTNACSNQPFNMGYEDGSAYYILQADASSCGPIGTPEASPVAIPATEAALADLFIVGPGTNTTDLETDAAVGTLDENGLTLPTTNGESVTIPDVVRVEDITEPGLALITRADDSPAVIDLTTGDTVTDVSTIVPYGLYRPYLFTPIDETFTDWTITDLRTGDSRLLSDIIELPADTGVLPLVSEITDEARVVRISYGTPTEFGFEDIAPDGAFVIAGSLNHLAPLPDLVRYAPASADVPLVMNAEADMVAYRTESSDNRIVILDTTTGDELARIGTDAVGNDSSLAGFTDDGRMIVLTEDSVLAVDLDANQQITTIAEGLEDAQNPLLYASQDLLYVRQGSTLLMLDLESGEQSEVATGMAPMASWFGVHPWHRFTTPGSDWITFLTQDGQTLIDSRTGEIVSQIKSPYRATVGGRNWVDDDGDTVIFASEPTRFSPDAGTAWLLSPAFPDGLELTAPDEDGEFMFWLSPDGATVYAMAVTSREPATGWGTGAIWSTSLSADPDWQLIGEDVELEGYFPLDG